MSEPFMVSYSEEQILRILEHPSLLSGANEGRTTMVSNDKIEQLKRLKKKQIRTELHAKVLLEHLKNNTIPWGLQVKNIPVIFTNDRQYLGGFSGVGTRCSRDWLALSIETALRINEVELKEIERLQREIAEDNNIQGAKKVLEDIEKMIVEFKTFTVNQKTTKLERDIKNFSLESTYPYLRENFFKETTPANLNQSYQGRSRRRFITFSETSSDSSSDAPSTSEQNYVNTDSQSFLFRAGRRGRGGGDRRGRGRLITSGDMRTRRRYYKW